MQPAADPPLAIRLLSAAVISAELIAWAFIAARLRSGRGLVPYAPRRPVPWNWVDVLMALALWFVLNSLAAWGLAEHYGGILPQPMRPLELLVFLVAELATFAIVIALLRLGPKATLADLGFDPRRIGGDIALGVVTYLAIIGPLLLLQEVLEKILPYQHFLIEALDKAHQEGHDAAMLAVAAAAALVVAPLCEEFLFRVLLQGWLESLEMRGRGQQPAAPPPLTPPPDAPAPTDAPPVAEATPAPPPKHPLLWRPIVISSALFAVAHLGQGLGPVTLFFLALALGYVYQRTHRIWPSMVVHALVNGGSVVQLWILMHAKPG